MAKSNTRDEWAAAQRNYQAAISEAGLQQPMQEAYVRHDSRSFAHRADDLERDERKLVFSVQDIALRRRIIHWERECQRLYRAVEAEELAQLRKEVREGGDKIRRNALLLAAGAGAALVLGAGTWGVVFAVAGATVSILLGVSILLEAERRAVKSLEEAKQQLNERENTLAELTGDGMFSAAEEESGIPERQT